MDGDSDCVKSDGPGSRIIYFSADDRVFAQLPPPQSGLRKPGGAVGGDARNFTPADDPFAVTNPRQSVVAREGGQEREISGGTIKCDGARHHGRNSGRNIARRSDRHSKSSRKSNWLVDADWWPKAGGLSLPGGRSPRSGDRIT